MSEWREVLLEDVASEITVGYVGPMASEYINEGIPFLRSQNVDFLWINKKDIKFITPEFHKKLQKSALSPGDVVIVRTGKPGTCAIIPDSLPIANCSDLVIVRCSDELDPRFLVYYVNSAATHHVASHLVGAVQQHFNVASARKMQLKLPEIAEQRAIAHILGTLDDKIELNRRMNGTLEAMARTIFKSWFVDFDPVRAKAEARDTGLPKDVADLFPDSFEDSELGEVPRGWKVATLSELCTLGRGASPRPINDFMNGEVPWIKIADATTANGPFLFETKEKIKLEGVSKSVSVFPGDLILSNSATCGIPIFVEINGCIHDGWLYFKNLQLISKLYLYHVLIELSEHLINIADGSVQKNLNTNLVGKQPVLVPPEFLMDAFDQQASVIFGKIQLLCLESRTFAELRDTLLPKLISGELRVNEAEKLVRCET